MRSPRCGSGIHLQTIERALPFASATIAPGPSQPRTPVLHDYFSPSIPAKPTLLAGHFSGASSQVHQHCPVHAFTVMDKSIMLHRCGHRLILGCGSETPLRELAYAKGACTNWSSHSFGPSLPVTVGHTLPGFSLPSSRRHLASRFGIRTVARRAVLAVSLKSNKAYADVTSRKLEITDASASGVANGFYLEYSDLSYQAF